MYYLLFSVAHTFKNERILLLFCGGQLCERFLTVFLVEGLVLFKPQTEEQIKHYINNLKQCKDQVVR